MRLLVSGWISNFATLDVKHDGCLDSVLFTVVAVVLSFCFTVLLYTYLFDISCLRCDE